MFVDHNIYPPNMDFTVIIYNYGLTGRKVMSELKRFFVYLGPFFFFNL